MFFRNASRDEFVSRCAGKKIICFGASRMPHEAVRELPISGQIECILDNNPDKIGRNVILCDRKIPVHTPEWLCGKQLNGHILLITSRFYYDIFQQLQQYRTLDGVDCYAWPCLMLDDESTPEKLRQSRIASQCRENYREYLDACALPPEETVSAAIAAPAFIENTQPVTVKCGHLVILRRDRHLESVLEGHPVGQSGLKMGKFLGQ